MFRALVSLEPIGESSSFCEAFRIFFTKITEIIKRGNASIQWLETANFIEYQNGVSKRVMTYYQARDFAYDIGLLQGEGVLQESFADPAPSDLERAFSGAHLEHLKSLAMGI